MAQWAGGFSGNTHGTRVEDAETALRHAVTSLKSQGADDRSSKAATTVRQLAKRLLSARVRLLKARLSAMQNARTTRSTADSQEFASLRQRSTSAQDQGLPGILAEFSVEEVLDSGKSK